MSGDPWIHGFELWLSRIGYAGFLMFSVFYVCRGAIRYWKET